MLHISFLFGNQNSYSLGKDYGFLCYLDLEKIEQ